MAMKKIISFLSSLRLTVLGLLILAVLTLWGTFYQVDHGIYAAKERFFNAWFLFVFGVIPFPGLKTVIAILSCNLVFSMIFRMPKNIRLAGLTCIHAGIILLFIAAGFTHYFAHESYLTLAEGESSSVSSSRTSWEIAIAGQHGPSSTRALVVQLEKLRHDSTVAVPQLNISLRAITFHENTQLDRTDADNPIVIPLVSHRNPSKNLPGVTCAVTLTDNPGFGPQTVTLHPMLPQPPSIVAGNQRLFFHLRPQTLPLPVKLKLLDFQKHTYAASSKARDYASRVEVTGPGIGREVVISMNKPFQYANYTFFQSSYTQDDGYEATTLAIVKNAGKFLPYLSSLVIVAGFFLHFGLMFVGKMRRGNNDG